MRERVAVQVHRAAREPQAVAAEDGRVVRERHGREETVEVRVAARAHQAHRAVAVRPVARDDEVVLEPLVGL